MNYLNLCYFHSTQSSVIHHFLANSTVDVTTGGAVFKPSALNEAIHVKEMSQRTQNMQFSFSDEGVLLSPLPAQL